MEAGQYPSATPDALKRELLPHVKAAAKAVGFEMAQRNLALSDEFADVICLALCAVSTCVAHHCLDQRERLIKLRCVRDWVDVAPAGGEGTRGQNGVRF